jgi:hypothetical protein
MHLFFQLVFIRVSLRILVRYETEVQEQGALHAADKLHDSALEEVDAYIRYIDSPRDIRPRLLGIKVEAAVFAGYTLAVFGSAGSVLVKALIDLRADAGINHNGTCSTMCDLGQASAPAPAPFGGGWWP